MGQQLYCQDCFHRCPIPLMPIEIYRAVVDTSRQTPLREERLMARDVLNLERWLMHCHKKGGFIICHKIGKRG